MAQSQTRGPLRRAAVRGWMGFDIAAQPFFTVVLTFVFGPYVVSTVAQNPAAGQAAWGLAATVAGLLIALLSPVLGAVADRAGPRKPWIAGFAAVKIAALCLLWFAAPGTPLLPVLALVVIAQGSAEFSIVFNDAMLPSLVTPAEVGRVSNVAWGLGYAGGLVFLAGTLAFLAADAASGRTIAGLVPLFGLDPSAGEGARATAPLAALWYLLLLLPMMVFTPDRATRSALGPAIRAALADLGATGREARRRPALFRFLVARMIYQDGVNALLILGGTFAAVLFGWTITESGLFGILLNVAAIAGCLVAGRLDQRLGPKPVVAASVAILLVATFGIVSTGRDSTLFGLLAFSPGDAAGLFATPAEKAYLFWGSLVGVAFGPVQASSRSWLARSVTPEEAGRFFGFYALTGRATSFAATLSVSALTAAALPFTDAESAARIGMSVLVLFFAVGLLALLGTPAPQNPAEERPAEATPAPAAPLTLAPDLLEHGGAAQGRGSPPPMPSISPRAALLALLALAPSVAPGPARANDSAAEKAAGGLVLTKSASVAMESEDLTISPTRIDVAYVFRNRGPRDETLTVAFPLPPIEGYGVSMEPVDLPDPETRNFVGFTVEADGRRIEPEVEERAFLGSRDVSALLKDNGLPLNPVSADLGAAFANLSKAAYAKLEAEKLLTQRDFGEALWRYEVRFHFDQLFPAGKPVAIRHSYRPVAGARFLTKGWFEEEASVRPYCVDAGTKKALEAVLLKAGRTALEADPVGNSPLKADPMGGLAYLRTVPYILTTANNWSGPIGRFRLVIDKGAPQNVVSLCQDGIRKTGPTRFEFEAKDYAPKRDLDILFVSPDAAGFSAE